MNDPGKYKFRYGQFIRRRIKDIDLRCLVKHLRWIESVEEKTYAVRQAQKHIRAYFDLPEVQRKLLFLRFRQIEFEF